MTIFTPFLTFVFVFLATYFVVNMWCRYQNWKRRQKEVIEDLKSFEGKLTDVEDKIKTSRMLVDMLELMVKGPPQDHGTTTGDERKGSWSDDRVQKSLNDGEKAIFEEFKRKVTTDIKYLEAEGYAVHGSINYNKFRGFDARVVAVPSSGKSIKGICWKYDCVGGKPVRTESSF